MDTISIIRKVDPVGGIVIPYEARELLSIRKKDPLEISIDEEAGKPVIIMKKYYPGCVFCDAADDGINFKGKFVCRKCIEEM